MRVRVCVHVSDSLILGGERRSVREGGAVFGAGGGPGSEEISSGPVQVLRKISGGSGERAAFAAL